MEKQGMSFWATTTAAPSIWMAAGLAPRMPEYIRNVPAPLPEIPSGMYIFPVILTDFVGQIASFWRTHYRGSDWIYDPTPGVVESVVTSYVRDENVFFYCLAEKGNHALTATIVSTPLTEGRVIIGPPQITMKECRVIEGLCVRADYRSRGIAGFMIAYMDYFTSQREPVAHIWSRELAVAPWSLFSTALHVKTYAYVKATDIKSEHRTDEFYDRMPWPAFCQLWGASVIPWNTIKPGIVSTRPQNRRGDLRVYATKMASPLERQKIVVITDTRRVTVGASESLKILEVVWCGTAVRGVLTPGSACDFQQFLNSVCATDLSGGILFALGSASAPWSAPWVAGRSGVHAWYMYNFVPPAFGSCELYAVREEI
jgi:hypothetical protein